MAAVTTNGIRMYYERKGSGEPVLFVPGLLWSAESFRPHMDALADYDVVGVDLRGQFRTEAPEDAATYDLWNQAKDLHGLIQALGIGPVHWVGLSMGGMIGLRLYLTHPEDFRSMVLMNTTARPEEPEKVERYEAMRQIVAAGQIEAVESALPTIFLGTEYVATHPDEIRAWIDDLKAADQMGLVRASRAVDDRDDVTARVGEIAVPTLVIHGDDDVPIELEKAEELAGLIPGARFEVVAGAGHMSCVDHPVETTRLIREFLAEVRAPAPARS
jgi:3-oxoadipate enol-lactonase